jgi:NAD(P)-dependent dehydrogenase (short-subunit alcohol dehydrogenase family)
MKSLAVELAPDVRVNSVLPGAIKTEMTKAIFARPEVEDRFRRDYPLGVGQPDDIVHIVEFLLSDRARWITGQQLIVDGGRTVNITA